MVFVHHRFVCGVVFAIKTQLILTEEIASMSHSHFVFYTRPQFIHSEIKHLPPLLLPFKPSSFLLAVLPLVGGPEVLILEIFEEFSANLAVGVPGEKKRL